MNKPDWAMSRLGKAMRWGSVAGLAVLLFTYTASVALTLSCYQNGHGRGVALARGCLILVWWHPAPDRPRTIAADWSFEWADHSVWWQPGHSVAGSRHRIVVPLWIPLSLMALAASASWRPVLRAASWCRHNRCATCGFHLIGTTTGVCPECGARGQ
jgi:hypothetical protein